jgi:hypothetical protein
MMALLCCHKGCRQCGTHQSVPGIVRRSPESF